MSKKTNIQLPRDKLAEFCKRNRVRRLSLFGSALKGELRKDSDIDLLVEFQPGEAPSLFVSCSNGEGAFETSSWSKGRLAYSRRA
jgi:predicted nucleotidyltransferase